MNNVPSALSMLWHSASHQQDDVGSCQDNNCGYRGREVHTGHPSAGGKDLHVLHVVDEPANVARSLGANC